MRRIIALLPLAVVVVLFLLLALLYQVYVPLGEGPDEPGHMAYVLFLARERRLPVQQSRQSESDVPGEGHQPPLSYALALPAVLWLPPEQMVLRQVENPQFLWRGGSEPSAMVRSSTEYWPWRSTTLAWHLARAVSSLVGALTVVCTWGAARTLVGRGGNSSAHAPTATVGWVVPLLAAGLVAFNPQFLFTSALVTNDALLAALSAALLWLCLARAATRRDAFVQAMAMWGFFGLALLTKQSALLLAPLLLWKGWSVGGGSPGHKARVFLALAGVPLLIAGWWYGRNWLLYGDPMGLATFQAAFSTQPFNWHTPAAWGSALVQLHASFWAMFGWLSVPAPAWVIGCYALLEGVALVGWLWHRRWVLAVSGGLVRLVPLGMLPLCAVAWVVSFALAAGLVAWQGRLIFPALPAIAIVLALGLSAWEREWGLFGARAFSAVVLLVLFGLALFLPMGVIAPSYQWHTVSPAVAQAAIATPTYARFAKEWEQGVELRGWSLDRGDGGGQPGAERVVQAGQTVTVTLFWHALERVPRDWTVFLHLVNAQGAIVAQHNSMPQDGGFPMTLWTTGDWIADPHPLALPADLPAGGYRLRAGWYKPWQRDPQKGSRQRVWDAAGNAVGDVVEIGVIVLDDAPSDNGQGPKKLTFNVFRLTNKNDVLYLLK